MALRAQIISPKLWGNLPLVFRHHCQITAVDPTATPTTYGEPGGTAAVVPGCDAIPCTAPQRAGTLAAGETALPYATTARIQWAVMLAGEYPQITERMIATIDGVAYNITTVMHVSVGGFTTLSVERVVT